MKSVALACDDHGAGPPLLILHGLFGSARNWQSQARALAGRYRVVCVDQRNHGRSPHAQASDYPAMAADVLQLMDTLQLESVTLLGHSMGGKVAMTLALQAPARVRRLIVVDIAPQAYPDQHTPVIDAMLALPLARITRRQQADDWLAAAVPDPTIRLFLLQNLQLGVSGAAWRLNLAALRASMPALSGALALPAGVCFDGPAHAIRGASSRRVDEACLPRFRALFPRLVVHTVEGAGHWPHTEAPAAFRACLECALNT